MRVTSDIVSRQVMRDVTAVAASLQKLQTQISSGKRIQNASEDPVAKTRALFVQSDRDAMERYQNSAVSGMSWLTATSSALTSLEDTLLEVLDLGSQGASSLLDQETRSALADQVDEYLGEILNLANTSTEGKYLFAGTQTLTAPFSGEDTNADGKTDSVVQTNPAGIDAQISKSIGKDQVLTVNSGGGALFQPGGEGAADDIFQLVIELRDALDAGDLDAIATCNSGLEDAFSRVVNENALTGAKSNRLQATLDRLDVDILNATGRISDLEDTDYVKASLDYQTKQNIYQAALDVGSTLIQMSLVDYL